jgi:lysophospholipase L1-like esterase
VKKYSLRALLPSFIFLSGMIGINPSWGLNVYLPLISKYYPPCSLVITAVGDSITVGIDTSHPPDTAYPALLQGSLRALYPFANYTVTNILDNYWYGLYTEWARDNMGPVIDRHHPNLVLLMSGTNDHANEWDFADIDSNLRSAVAIAQSKGVKVIIATNPPVWGDERQEQQQRIFDFRGYIFSIANDYGIPVVDSFDCIAGQSDWESTLMATGNHPNDAGQRRLRDCFLQTITANMDSLGCYTAPR